MSAGPPKRWLVRGDFDTFVVRINPPPLSDVEREETEYSLFVWLTDYFARKPQAIHTMEELHHALFDGFHTFLGPRPVGGDVAYELHVRRIVGDIQSAFEAGRLSFLRQPTPRIRIRLDEVEPVSPELAPPKERDPTFFEARFVDEIGEAIAGIEVVITTEGKAHHLTADGNGKVRLDRVRESFASVRVANAQALRDAIKPRWDQVREAPLVEPSQDTTTVLLRSGPLESIRLECERLHTVSVQPRVIQARLIGTFFDTNKNFLSPSAIPSLRGIRKLYDENPRSTLLIVGHTDTSGDPSINDPLSVERAESVAAFLKDDVDEWRKRYVTSVPESKRWGAHEDEQMLNALLSQANPTFVGGPDTGDDQVPDETPIIKYQRQHNATRVERRSSAWEELVEDGLMGPNTRRQLIADYMNQDKTSLPLGVELVVHGCGENFPLDPTGEEIELAPDDERRDQIDRRVELFFFDRALGVQPQPPAKNSNPGGREYPEWRRRAQETRNFLLFTRTLRLFLLDENYQRMPGTEYELRAANSVRRGKSDANGCLVEPGVPLSGTCELRWARSRLLDPPNPDLDPPQRYKETPLTFRFRSALDLSFEEEVSDADLQNEALVRLSNMGYQHRSLDLAYPAFRKDYKFDPDVPFDRQGFDELARVHREGIEAPLISPKSIGSDGEEQVFEDDGGIALPIEIELLLDDGQPAAGQRFEVGTGTDTLRAGVLDADGRAIIADLDPGEYFVAFPDLDREAWARDSEVAGA